MTPSPTPLDYATPARGVCPLCSDRPVGRKALYGWPVCKKCLYKFANRRQVAYLVDALLFAVVVFPVMWWVGGQLGTLGWTELQVEIAVTAIALLLNVMFVLKDGFDGQSPGKRLTGVQVIDEATGRPISFAQSFKRNAVLLVGVIPVVGGLASLAVVVTIAIQMNKGHRLGDRFAGTRVVWKRHADSPVYGGSDSLCRQCGYDLTGNESGRCPECGTPAAAA